MSMSMSMSGSMSTSGAQTGPIVCATRGGQASRRSQERAIALAKERGAELIFLCVTDPNFVTVHDEQLEAALTDELRRLGRSLLCIAQSRAEKRGLATEAIVQCGPVWENIEAYLRQVDAATLVIGSSQVESETAEDELGQLEQFAEELRSSLGIEVVLVE